MSKLKTFFHAKYFGGHGCRVAAIHLLTVVYRTVSHVYPISAYLYHRQRTNDRDLSHGEPGPHSFCNLWKQRAEHDGAELSEIPICVGLSGIHDHGVHRHLCDTHT